MYAIWLIAGVVKGDGTWSAVCSVIDDPDSASEEKFRQGSMGILYTNFYKMMSIRIV